MSARTLDKVSTKLQQIATRAKAAPQMVFTNLAHSIDLDFLRKAHRSVRKDGAAGVDRVRAQHYALNLDVNLEDLLVRMRAGSYKAPPVKRVYIPKDDKGNTRPRGMRAIQQFALQFRRLWCKWLSRRSRKARLNWEAMNKLLKRYPLPRPIIVHSVFKIAASH